jgi:hypothetical protein
MNGLAAEKRLLQPKLSAAQAHQPSRIPIIVPPPNVAAFVSRTLASGSSGVRRENAIGAG